MPATVTTSQGERQALWTPTVIPLDRLFRPGDHAGPRGAAMDVGGWLRRLGLEQYEAAFRENKIDDTVLPSLTRRTCRILVSDLSGIAANCSTP